MKSDFLLAITQLSAEKNLPRAVVFKAVEQALAMAFKKEAFAADQNVSVKIAPATGDFKVYVQKKVVDEVADPSREISLSDALAMEPKAAVGALVDVEATPKSAGRIAAQTAKQVVLQRLREAEREVVYEEYVDKAGEILSGVVQRVEPRQITINLGKGEAVLPMSEQVRTERYRLGQRVKVYVVEVAKGVKGPQVIVSRSHRELLRKLLELEVPEVQRGVVEIKDIAREPGSRSKVSVVAKQEKVDAVGSCVGLRGIRIQNVVNELGGEKVDVVQWHSDPRVYIANALSPAPVISVDIDPEQKVAQVVVPDRQLSLAIGKEGQNARLAAKLTGWKVDLKGSSVAEAERVVQPVAVAAGATVPAIAQATPSAVEAPVQVEALVQVPVAAAAAATVAPAPVMEPPSPAVEAPVEVATPVEEELVFIPQAPETPQAPGERPRIRFAEELLGAPTRDLEAKGKGVKATKAAKAGPKEAERRRELAAPVRKKRPRLADLLNEEDLDSDIEVEHKATP